MKARSATIASSSRKSLLSFGAAALLSLSAAVLLTVTTATAQVASGTSGASGIDSSGNYRQEVQACMDGRTQQDQNTCLREARNARAERQRGTPDQPDYAANAMARCDALNGEEKAACRARVMGYGSTSGSVAGGGVLREVETVVMPPEGGTITVEPKTSAGPVVLVPAR